MSQAKVHRAGKARKEWTCGKCKTVVKVGEPVLSFSVGFRGREQRRCTKPECYPTRSELESSQVAPVYDAVDNADWNSAETVEDLQSILQEVADVFREVASEYENSEMFEKNPDLQERVEILSASADTLEGWEPEEQEPDSESPETWDDHPTFEEALDAWRVIARQAAQETADEVEIP